MRSRFLFRVLLAALLAPGFAALAAHASVGHGQQIVHPFPAQIALTVTPSSPVSGSTVAIAASLTATGSNEAGPTGTVTFTIDPSNGSPVITKAVLIENGTAAWSEVPPSGVNKIEAVYSGDTNYAAARADATFSVPTPTSPDFDFTLPSVTLVAGQSYNGKITVTPKNGFSGTVTFTVGALPKNINFALSSPSVHLDSSDSDTAVPDVSFTIATKATVVTAAAGFLFLGLFGFRQRQRSRRTFTLMAILCLSGLALVTGCAATHFDQQNGTPPGTYSIPITATSGSLTHTHDLTLIVTTNAN